MISPVQIELKRGLAKIARREHPWVFAGSIERLKGAPADGEIVQTVDFRGRFIAYGIYNSKSQIRIRLFSWDSAVCLDDRFWSQKIETAISFREPDKARRLISSEADGLSGLTVDQYNEYLVVQITSLAMANRLPLIASTLERLISPKGILLKTPKEIAKKEGIVVQDRILSGEVPQIPIQIKDGELEFEVSLLEGQKTGFYLDQKENRRAAAKFAPGRTVLDLFTYSGGFALHCAKGGAKEVTAVDSSVAAIASAERNAQQNRLKNVQFVRDDVLEFLGRDQSTYSMIILDPPKLARSKESKQQALKMYYRLNMEAVRHLEPGGILVTCSCSGRLSWRDFHSILKSVAARSKKNLEVIEKRGASKDHPIHPHCPETEYLKCIIARIRETHD